MDHGSPPTPKTLSTTTCRSRPYGHGEVQLNGMLLNASTAAPMSLKASGVFHQRFMVVGRYHGGGKYLVRKYFRSIY